MYVDYTYKIEQLQLDVEELVGEGFVPISTETIDGLFA